MLEIGLYAGDGIVCWEIGLYDGNRIVWWIV